jgi:Cytochrome c554 and c-prime
VGDPVRTLFCAALLTMTSLWAALPPADAVRPVEPARPFGADAPGFRQLSSVSCAAAACHGNGSPGRRGGEYSTWAPDLSANRPRDPHGYAYRVLFNDAAVRIAQRLGLPAAHEEALCLKCHAVGGVEPASAVAEGVGCGACHGPAEKWVSTHYLSGWKTLPPREKWKRYGFVPTKNLTARVLTCVGCHVGDETREVNHDLIAAGHPRLAFEYTRFHFHPDYRRHWVERTPQPDFEIRAWVAGQAATLRAAADLLRARAERAEGNAAATTWPEFSGYSCYSCHRPIGAGLAGPFAPGPRVPGSPGWELWSTAAVEVAAAQTPAAFPGCSVPALRSVRDLQELMKAPQPRPATLRVKAAAAVAELDAWLAELQAAEDDGPVERLAPELPGTVARALAADALTADRRALRDHDWDFLAAHALGCGAMVHAAGGPAVVPGIGAPTRGLFELLRFPPPVNGRQSNGPAGFGPDQLARVRDHFRSLSDAAMPSGAK